jgi:hypothetical protein
MNLNGSLQSHLNPKLVKPMANSIKQMYECTDEEMQSDAKYIITEMAGEAELFGEYTPHFLEEFANGRMPELTGWIFCI